MPSHLPGHLRERLERVRLLITDVDGVLTDGVLVYSPQGDTAKRFHVKDGLAVRLLQDAGIAVAVLTGRRSETVALRFRELGLPDALVIQGSTDKAGDLDALEAHLGIGDESIAVVGDDLPDLPMLTRAGFATCPSDAAPEVAAVCHFVCGVAGGQGVIREVTELILKAQGRWDAAVSRWTRTAPTEPA